VEALYRRIQLPKSWVDRLTEELEAEIVERQAEASERRVVLTKTLSRLAEERGKLLQAFYANAIPLELLKVEQERIGGAEQAAKVELEAAEGDLAGWQDVLRTAIRLAGNCYAAYTKARPSVRCRFNDAVLDAVYIKDRRIGRAEFSEVFAPLFSRPSSNKALKVDPRGRYSNHLNSLRRLLLDLDRGHGHRAARAPRGTETSQPRLGGRKQPPLASDPGAPACRTAPRPTCPR
jgi:hypothetical protein